MGSFSEPYTTVQHNSRVMNNDVALYTLQKTTLFGTEVTHRDWHTRVSSTLIPTETSCSQKTSKAQRM